MQYLIRIGQFGQIGKFGSRLKFNLAYGTEVICRTARGLEKGEFLQTIESKHPVSGDPESTRYDLVSGKVASGELADGELADGELADGELLRKMTPRDQLLAQRLDQNKQKAIRHCQDAIVERGLSVALIDAEQTFDGMHLYFYFLGEITSEVEAMTDELTRTYDATVKFSEFAETLNQGCGPDCGTEAAAGGCGPGGCSGCGLKSACRS